MRRYVGVNRTGIRSPSLLHRQQKDKKRTKQNE